MKKFKKDFDFCHKSESFFVITYVGAENSYFLLLKK